LCCQQFNKPGSVKLDPYANGFTTVILKIKADVFNNPMLLCDKPFESTYMVTGKKVTEKKVTEIKSQICLGNKFTGKKVTSSIFYFVYILFYFNRNMEAKIKRILLDNGAYCRLLPLELFDDPPG
jgi:hypothetical protein